MVALVPRAHDAQERPTCMDALVPRAQDAQERPTRMDALVPRAQNARERPPRQACTITGPPPTALARIGYTPGRWRRQGLAVGTDDDLATSAAEVLVDKAAEIGQGGWRSSGVSGVSTCGRRRLRQETRALVDDGHLNTRCWVANSSLAD